MSKQTEAEILKRNVIINACIRGLTSSDVKVKQLSLEEILRQNTTEVEFADIKQRERWDAEQIE